MLCTMKCVEDLLFLPGLCQLCHREQQLQSLLQKRDYENAVGLAITLDQPFRVLTILMDEL